MKRIPLILTGLFLSLLSAAIEPIPQSIDYDRQKAALGKKLFFEGRLSKDGTVACVNCHQLPGSGADVSEFSFGVDGAEGNINSPTVFNAVFNFVQFWDGRAENLEEQARGPISNPVEMANSMENVVAMLKSDNDYRHDFSSIYTDGVTPENIVDAIAEFERALITPNARFDRYLRGEKDALNEQEREGYAFFQGFGCISCHNGVNIGGNMYQKVGVFLPYEDKTNNLGRYNVTKLEADKFYFKVPSLRNIELTAPYMHDGKAKTLEDAVFEMFEHQLGDAYTQAEMDAIVAFLKTLTGEQPAILKEP